MATWRKSECRGCGRAIVWVKNPETNKAVPLDPAPPVYAVAVEGEELVGRTVERETMMVSHFATCPKANEMRKPAAPAEQGRG